MESANTRVLEFAPDVGQLQKGGMGRGLETARTSKAYLQKLGYKFRS
jgi:hypothetical protein